MNLAHRLRPGLSRDSGEQDPGSGVGVGRAVGLVSKHSRRRGDLIWHTTKPSKGQRKLWARHIDKLAREARKANRP